MHEVVEFARGHPFELCCCLPGFHAVGDQRLLAVAVQMVPPCLVLPVHKVLDDIVRSRGDGAGVKRDRLGAFKREGERTCRKRCSYRIDLLHSSREREFGEVQADLIGERVRKLRRETAVSHEAPADCTHRMGEPGVKRLCKAQQVGEPVECPPVKTHNHRRDGGDRGKEFTVFHTATSAGNWRKRDRYCARNTTGSIQRRCRGECTGQVADEHDIINCGDDAVRDLQAFEVL